MISLHASSGREYSVWQKQNRANHQQRKVVNNDNHRRVISSNHEGVQQRPDNNG